MPLLNVASLSHSFDYPLFENISLDLAPKESLSVVGVSGSGKSTLLHICATLLKPKKGKVNIFGEDIYAKPAKELLHVRRKHIGIIFQSHYLFKGFSAFENVELATLLNATPLEPSLLERLGIQKVMHQNVSELSGGQQQRVSIARVLSKKPKIIFADEPTGNLDGQTANEVMDVLFEYINDNGAALLLVSHDMQMAKRCDKQLMLKSENVKE